jgi:hypothetical protein
MHRDSSQVTAEVVWTDAQWELRLFGDGGLITWRRFPQRASTVAFADCFQQELERDGWQ